MRAQRPRGPAATFVTVVSGNAETVDGLEAYLRRAGVETATTRALEKLAATTPPRAAAVVIFPDDFEFESVVRHVGALAAGRADLLVVLVTKDPKRFNALELSAGVALLVIPRPAWGWTILDAIRARLDPPSTEGESTE
ncbi:MAG: hypothetical protein IPM35_37285 [Myxococcales bacterium]|nr:hypothetical protein [Myxococcales bacterium]